MDREWSRRAPNRMAVSLKKAEKMIRETRAYIDRMRGHIDRTQVHIDRTRAHIASIAAFLEHPRTIRKDRRK
jgi:hypothetical protein